MAAFYLDNDVAVQVAPELVVQRHLVTTTRARALQRATDATQLLVAKQHGEILVTCNRQDFLLVQEAWLRWPADWGVSSPPRHSGILVIPQAWAAIHAAHELDQFVRSHPALANTLHWYEPKASWQAGP